VWKLCWITKKKDFVLLINLLQFVATFYPQLTIFKQAELLGISCTRFHTYPSTRSFKEGSVLDRDQIRQSYCSSVAEYGAMLHSTVAYVIAQAERLEEERSRY
jgi:hypothetical protein